MKSIIVNQKTGLVTNIIVGSVNRQGFDCIEWTPEHRQVSIGWTYENGSFVDKRPKPDSDIPQKVVLPDISDRQFFQQLAVAGLITQAEALAAVRTGELPAAIEAIVDDMPSEAQFSARMVLSGATTFQHSHPLVEVFRTAVGMTTEQFTQFWLSASKL